MEDLCSAPGCKNLRRGRHGVQGRRKSSIDSQLVEGLEDFLPGTSDVEASVDMDLELGGAVPGSRRTAYSVM